MLMTGPSRAVKLHIVVDADENFCGNAVMVLNCCVWTVKVEVVKMVM